jgi:hypothetical protein
MPPRIYRIHDNGGVPFKVEDRGDAVQIWKQRSEEEMWRRYTPLLELSYTEIYPGRFPHRRWHSDIKEHYHWKPSYNGNSVLLFIGNSKYVYIGESIWEFNTNGDRILEYFSPIGNSDVPYPFAVGERFTYLMLERTQFPNSLLDATNDPYAQWYGFSNAITPEKHSTLLAAKQELEVTILQGRLY